MSRTPAAKAASLLYRRSQILRSPDKDPSHSDKGQGKLPGERKRLGLVEVETATDVILSCMDMLLIKRMREVSTNRVLGFVKRLAGAALVMTDPACTASMLIRILHYLRMFPRCEVLFDVDAEIGGPYLPDVDDPEFARPASACLWELYLLKSHHSQIVSIVYNPNIFLSFLILISFIPFYYENFDERNLQSCITEICPICIVSRP
ncbi:unnamed protein product [Protopolystoma xenopodis]|uniref:CCAAT-binding factor domain-containing protein n=1 Tax=Protopolystoma xenopodis TaxID=117903 RepID=A0A3S5B287_9PLAT|nr:unnamed protein product [Protopolystoma xenopodis]